MIVPTHFSSLFLAPSSSLFGGQPAAAPSFGSQPATNLATQQQAALQYATLLSNHTIGPSADALLAQQLAAVEKQKKDMELMRAWRGNYEAGSKVVATSNYEQESGDNWTSAAPSSALISNYRAAPRSAAKIRPRGYSPATKPSAVASLGRKNGGSPILSPNRFVGSATKALFIKPGSLTPRPKTRLLLTNGISNGNGDSSVANLENGRFSSPNGYPSQHLQSPDATSATAPKPVDSVSPQGKPSPAHDFYNQVVGSPDGTNVVASPVHTVSHYVPKLTKTGYNVYPPISELETMSEADLAAVADFKVERPGYGSVAWDGSVDVRGVDLDSVVVIETKNVSVYDDAELNGDKPRQGSKLNRPAVITMFGIYPKGGAESSVEAKEKLKKKIEKSTKKMGADLLSFDADGGVWTFRVGHFSRYGLDDEDSDDEDTVDESEANATPSLATLDDEHGLGGISKMMAPNDEDDSTAYTDASERIEEEVEEDEEDAFEIVRAGEQAYAMMTEDVMGGYEEAAIIPHDPVTCEVAEEKILFPNEAEDISVAVASDSLKPTAPLPYSSPASGICSQLAGTVGLKNTSSSNINYGLRMRRSFRVGKMYDA